LASHYVLVDFENVQPKNIEAIAGFDCKLMVFLGASQAKISTEIVVQVQQLGPKAEYVIISGNGSNSLDFHIAFYIGQIAALHPSTRFHIVSKDTGFDPLIIHLKSKKISVSRVKAVADLTFLKATKPPIELPKSEAILARLLQMKASKPRTVKTLTSTVVAHFKKQISEPQALDLIKELSKLGKVIIDGTKVSYEL
jgi:PIN domain